MLKYIVLLLLVLIAFPLLIWNDLSWALLFPLGLLTIYYAVFNTKWVFIFLGFFTPLSINIEEYNDSFGLFLPTEPILFGFLVLILAMQLIKPFIRREMYSHPLFLLIALYLFWMLVSAIASSSMLISFKFLLARIWIIVPVVVLGAYYFNQIKNLKRFLWLFIVSLAIVIVYTLLNHAQYGFDEKSGHWVMTPFFKDHTIYGAIIALSLPFAVGLWILEKNNPLLQGTAILVFLVLILGIVFSYSRAAWLSVIVASVLCFLVYYRVRFVYLITAFVVLISIVGYKWDSIVMELERNKKEHTAKNIEERFESATNVSTDASNLERINRWDCAISMFKERPIFGFGPGTYAFEYARFQDPENLTIISTNFGNLGNAHSEYLGTLSEMGLLGAILFIVMIAYLFFRCIALYQSLTQEHKEIKIMLLVFLFSLSTYFTHAFLNNFLDTDKAAIPIWAMAGALIGFDLLYKKSPTEPQ